MMQKKEQEVYFALQGKHSYDKLKNFFDPHISCRPGRVTANQHVLGPALL